MQRGASALFFVCCAWWWCLQADSWGGVWRAGCCKCGLQIPSLQEEQQWCQVGPRRALLSYSAAQLHSLPFLKYTISAEGKQQEKWTTGPFSTSLSSVRATIDYGGAALTFQFKWVWHAFTGGSGECVRSFLLFVSKGCTVSFCLSWEVYGVFLEAREHGSVWML